MPPHSATDINTAAAAGTKKTSLSAQLRLDLSALRNVRRASSYSLRNSVDVQSGAKTEEPNKNQAENVEAPANNQPVKQTCDNTQSPNVDKTTSKSPNKSENKSPNKNENKSDNNTHTSVQEPPVQPAKEVIRCMLTTTSPPSSGRQTGPERKTQGEDQLESPVIAVHDERWEA